MSDQGVEMDINSLATDIITIRENRNNTVTLGGQATNFPVSHNFGELASRYLPQCYDSIQKLSKILDSVLFKVWLCVAEREL